jgi:type VI secretion system protein ImpB
LAKFKERRFIEIDRDNFNEVMTKISPRLDISVPDTLKNDGSLKVELNFTNIDQFEPESIVNQIPRLARLLEARQQLRDLLGKLDGNDELDALLEQIVQNTEDLKSLKDASVSSNSDQNTIKNDVQVAASTTVKVENKSDANSDPKDKDESPSNSKKK